MKIKTFLEKFQYIPTNDLRKKVIGGQAADPGEYPWQVLLVERYFDSATGQETYENVCGGTLISDRWVITANHCIKKRSWRYQILLGGHINPPEYQQNGTKNPNTDEKIKYLARIVRHPIGGLLTYDIALLKMDTRVTFGPKIFPACVPGPDYIFKNFKTVTTTGWGFVKSDPMSLLPTELQELELKIENRRYCESFIETGCSAGNMLAITSIFSQQSN
jgi:hypothetical protein